MIRRALPAGGLILLVASCADTDSADATAPDAQVAVPAPDAGSTPDADVDDCVGDGGDWRCTTQSRSCEESDFCSVSAPIGGRSLLAVWGSTKNDVWAAGTGGTIVHFDGTKWDAVESPTKQPIFALWGSSASDVWLASSRAAVFRGGAFQAGSTASTWTTLPELTPVRNPWSPKESMMLALWGSEKDDVWIGGEPYQIDEWGAFASQWRTRLPTEEDSSPWTATKIGGGTEATTPPIRGIWGSSKNDVWAVGGGDGLYYSNVSTRGKTYHSTSVDGSGLPVWTEVDSQSVALLFAVWGSAPGDVWAVGNEGTIRHWVTGAKRWEIVPSPTTENLRAIWGSGPNDIWVVGEYATILHYDGKSWELATSALAVGAKPNLNGVWGSGADDVWAVGKGITLHFTGRKPTRAP